ncbi:hypothetical protein [Streptomyces sp. KN37]|uniref:hypothetical protein n=1 Tax=Streptomyces sp. KN37 TaxID=3090667 RepID=UPI002A756B7D|nr:hypothetical protein [Streptomyces sp. KN37]WPO69923.1 hypothetical protein R9806_04400 [Streptomyces sp. KN37]
MFQAQIEAARMSALGAALHAAAAPGEGVSVSVRVPAGSSVTDKLEAAAAEVARQKGMRRRTPHPNEGPPPAA